MSGRGCRFCKLGTHKIRTKSDKELGLVIVPSDVDGPWDEASRAANDPTLTKWCGKCRASHRRFKEDAVAAASRPERRESQRVKTRDAKGAGEEEEIEEDSSFESSEREDEDEEEEDDDGEGPWRMADGREVDDEDEVAKLTAPNSRTPLSLLGPELRHRRHMNTRAELKNVKLALKRAQTKPEKGAAKAEEEAAGASRFQRNVDEINAWAEREGFGPHIMEKFAKGAADGKISLLERQMVCCTAFNALQTHQNRRRFPEEVKNFWEAASMQHSGSSAVRLVRGQGGGGTNNRALRTSEAKFNLSCVPNDTALRANRKKNLPDKEWTEGASEQTVNALLSEESGIFYKHEQLMVLADDTDLNLVELGYEGKWGELFRKSDASNPGCKVQWRELQEKYQRLLEPFKAYILDPLQADHPAQASDVETKLSALACILERDAVSALEDAVKMAEQALVKGGYAHEDDFEEEGGGGAGSDDEDEEPSGDTARMRSRCHWPQPERGEGGDESEGGEETESVEGSSGVEEEEEEEEEDGSGEGQEEEEQEEEEEEEDGTLAHTRTARGGRAHNARVDILRAVTARLGLVKLCIERMRDTSVRKALRVQAAVEALQDWINTERLVATRMRVYMLCGAQSGNAAAYAVFYLPRKMSADESRLMDIEQQRAWHDHPQAQRIVVRVEDGGGASALWGQRDEPATLQECLVQAEKEVDNCIAGVGVNASAQAKAGALKHLVCAQLRSLQKLPGIHQRGQTLFENRLVARAHPDIVGMAARLRLRDEDDAVSVEEKAAGALVGCKVVLVGAVKHDPEEVERLTSLVEACDGTVATNLIASVTHAIMAADDSSLTPSSGAVKSLQKYSSIILVLPSWLELTAEEGERAREEDHLALKCIPAPKMASADDAKVEVLCEHEGVKDWFEGRVVQKISSHVRVRYMDDPTTESSVEDDEWIPLNAARIQPLGTSERLSTRKRTLETDEVQDLVYKFTRMNPTDEKVDPEIRYSGEKSKSLEEQFGKEAADMFAKHGYTAEQIKAVEMGMILAEEPYVSQEQAAESWGEAQAYALYMDQETGEMWRELDPSIVRAEQEAGRLELGEGLAERESILRVFGDGGGQPMFLSGSLWAAAQEADGLDESKVQTVGKLKRLAIKVCKLKIALQAQEASRKALEEAGWMDEDDLWATGICDFTRHDVIPQASCVRNTAGRPVILLGIEDPPHKAGNLASSVRLQKEGVKHKKGPFKFLFPKGLLADVANRGVVEKGLPFQLILRVLEGRVDPANKAQASQMFLSKLFRREVAQEDPDVALALSVFGDLIEAFDTKGLTYEVRRRAVTRFEVLYNEIVRPFVKIDSIKHAPRSLAGIPVSLWRGFMRNCSTWRAYRACFFDVPVIERFWTSYPLEGLFSVVVVRCGFKPPAWQVRGVLQAILRLFMIRFDPHRRWWWTVSKRQHYDHSKAAQAAAGWNAPCREVQRDQASEVADAARALEARVKALIQVWNNGSGIERFQGSGEEEMTAAGQKQKGWRRKGVKQEKQHKVAAVREHHQAAEKR